MSLVARTSKLGPSKRWLHKKILRTAEAVLSAQIWYSHNLIGSHNYNFLELYHEEYHLVHFSDFENLQCCSICRMRKRSYRVGGVRRASMVSFKSCTGRYL